MAIGDSNDLFEDFKVTDTPEGVTLITDPVTTNAENKDAPAGAAAVADIPAEIKDAPVSDKTTATTDVPAAAINLKEIFGEELTLDQAKARVGEIKTLREEIEATKKTPKISFANERVAGYNEFVRKTGVDNHAVYQSILDVKSDDPLAVLTTKFILDNPEYAGKEEMIVKKLQSDYKITAEQTQDDIDINMIKVNTDAKAALKHITELRESLKVQSEAEKPVDMNVRTQEWKESLSKSIPVKNLAIPIFNSAKKEVETYLPEFKLEDAHVANFVEEMAPIYARMGGIESVPKERIKADFIGYTLAQNMPTIAAAIKLKAETEKEAELDAKYNNAGALKDKEEKPTGTQEKDPIDTLLG